MVAWILAVAAAEARDAERYECPAYSGSPWVNACECLVRPPWDALWLGTVRLYSVYPADSCFRDSYVQATWPGDPAYDLGYYRAKRQIDAMRDAYAKLLEAVPDKETLVSQYESEQIYPKDWVGFLKVDGKILLTDSWGKDIAWVDFPADTLRNVQRIDLDEDKQLDLVFGLDEGVWWAPGPFQEGEVLGPAKIDP